MDQDLTALERATGSKLQRLGFRVLDTRTYWVSHLTNEGKGARKVSRGIRETVRILAEQQAWETSSFYVFDSYASIDHIATMLRLQRRVRDVFLIGSFTHAECRIVGPCEDLLIYDLVPFAKRAGLIERNAKKSAQFKNLVAGRRRIIAQLAKARLAQRTSSQASR
jgi:hypothetical protein